MTHPPDKQAVPAEDDDAAESPTGDLTSRTQAVRALNESELRYRMLFESNPHPMWVYDLETLAFLEVNDAAVAHYGYSREEFLAMTIKDIRPAEDIPALLDSARDGADTTFEQSGPWRHATRSGEVRLVEVSSHTINLGGRNAKVVLALDVTKRAKAEAAVRQSEARFRAIYEAAPVGIFLIDPAGLITYANPAMLRMTGLQLEELTGLKWINAVHPDDGQRVRAEWQSSHAAGKPYVGTGRFLNASKEIVWWEATTAPVTDDGGALLGYVTMIVDITERRRAERALRESVTRLHLATEGSDTGLWDWKLNTDEVYYSPIWKRQIGYADDEIGNSFEEWRSRVHPDDLVHAMAIVQAYLRNPWPNYESEFRFRHKDGSYRWILAKGALMNDEHGRAVRMIGSHADITERKTAEIRIRQLNRIYAVLSGIDKSIVRRRDLQQVFSEACRVAVVQGGFRFAWIGRCDSNTLKLVAHAGASPDTLAILDAMLTGQREGCAFTAQAMQNGTYSVCNDIATDALAADWRDEALERGYRAMVSLPLRTEGRTVGTFNLYAPEAGFFNEMEMRLLEDLAANVSFAIEVNARERERLRAENELRRSEERFRTLIEDASDLITVVNASGIITYQSPSVQRLLGYAPGEMMSRAAIEFVHAEDIAEVAAAFSKAAHEPMTSVPFEYRIRHGDGSWRRIESIARNLPEEAPEGFIVVNSRDVTDRYALEQQLVESQKMQAIGTLAGGIAHDFNNILLAIIGNAELARQSLQVGEKEALDSIAEIQRAGARAKELVQRILTFSRPQEHQLRPIRLEPVLKEAVTLLRSTLPAGVEMRVYSAPDAPAVWADASQMHQIIVNLATNAWHAVEGSGEVEIRLEARHVDTSFRQLHQDLQPGPHLHLSVSDTGKGMTPEIAARIFEPFFTTKPPGQGTGLGLSVVHGIVRNHGGAVVVESESGQGSTFHIYLPATDEEVAAVAAKPASPWEHRGKGQHILYLDDEEPLVELAVHFLERLGYRVTGFTLAAEALARFRAAPYAFDLVITDLNMPGSSGMAVARQMLDIRPDVPVVLASGYVRQSEIEGARALGIREVILKPNTVEEFGPVVQRLLASGESPTPAI